MTDGLTPAADSLEAPFRGSFQGSGGVSLAFARWEHPAPRGRVVICHGYGEHGERYQHVARWLRSEGWSVSSMDLQGFGRSGGVRGDARGIRPFTEDLAFFLRQERAHDALLAGSPLTFREGVPVPAAPPWPQVVLGHSFGGLVSLLALLWHPDALDGLILSSPALALRPLPPLLRWLQRVLFWTAPHRPLELPNDKSLVCSDPAMVEAYWADPLCHRFVTAAFVASLEEGRRELMPMGGELDRPVLLLESGQDTVVDPDGAQALWPAFRPGLLERHRLEAVRHEIFHDRLRAQAQTIAASWLDRTFPDPSGGTSSRLAGTLNQAPEGTP